MLFLFAVADVSMIMMDEFGQSTGSWSATRLDFFFCRGHSFVLSSSEIIIAADAKKIMTTAKMIAVQIFVQIETDLAKKK